MPKALYARKAHDRSATVIASMKFMCYRVAAAQFRYASLDLGRPYAKTQQEGLRLTCVEADDVPYVDE